MKKPAKRKPRKPRRVVLAVGYPWFLIDQYGVRSHVCICESSGYQGRPRRLKFDDLGNYNRIRLIAEVLK